MKKLLQMFAFVALLTVPWAANAQSFCTPNPTSKDGSGITHVTFGEGSETVDANVTWSSAPYYHNYFSQVGAVAAGTTAEMAITFATGYTYGTIIWVDWNQDSLFTGTEVVYVGTSTSANPTVLTATFDIPATQATGNYLMRICAADSYFDSYVSSITAAANAPSCTTYTLGVALDYTLHVTAAPTCLRVQGITATAIDSNSMTLNWVDMLNTGASYTITYWPQGATADDTTMVGVNSGVYSYPLSNLNANTVYYFQITPNCSDGTNATSLTAHFRTACGVNSLPYNTGFEDCTSGEMAHCWLAVQTGTSGSGTFPAAYQYVYNAHTGSFYFEFESNAGDVEVAALPAIPSINGTKLTFWAYSGSPANVLLEVGVLEYDTVFVVKDTVRVTTEYQQYSVFYPDYSGPANRMAMRFTPSGSGTRYIMIDDVAITEFSGCIPVSNLTVDTVTADTVAVHWTAGYNETSWAVRANGGAWIDVYEPSYVFAGLSPATAYTIDVIVLCTDTSEMRSVSVRTECADYLNAPYVADFVNYNNATYLPWCWNAIETYLSWGSTYPQIYDYYHYLYFSVDDEDFNCVVLPRIDNLAPNAINVEVNAYRGSNTSRLYFGYVTNPDSVNTFVALDSISATSSTNYEFNTSSVENVDTIWLAFRCTTTGSSGYAYINSLRISRYSNCARPDAVVLDTVTHNSVEMHWNSTGADAYQIAVSTATDVANVSDEDLYDSDAGVDTVKVITGLTPSTNYNVWVRSFCSGDTSEWRQGPSFRTYCGEEYCIMALEMHDEYGDGWNGAAINLYLNGTLATNFTVSSGSSSNTGSFAVCDGDSVVLTWQEGNFDSECSFTVTLAGSNLLTIEEEGIYDYSTRYYSTGDTLVSFVGCPSCLPVTEVVVVDSVTTENSITIHWTPGDEADGMWAVMIGDSVVSTTVAETSYTFTGLTANMGYTFGVATVCGEGNISNYVTVQAGTACAGVACEVRLVMVDAYGDGWNGAALQIYQNGGLKGSATVPSGENYNVENVAVCQGDSVQIYWHEGSYDSECSFVVLNAMGDTLLNSDDLTNLNEGLLATTDTVSCPSCITPTNLRLVSATTTSVTIRWNDVTPATAWRVLLSDGDTTVSQIVNTNPCTLTGLQPSSVYYISLAAICDATAGDTSSYTNFLSVTTECAQITLPWDYNVATDMVGVSDQMPLCWYAPESWTVSYGSYGYNYPLAYSDGTDGYFYLPVDGGDATSSRVMVASPRVPEAGNDLYVRFHAAGSDGTLAQAGVMTNVNDPTTFIPVVTVPGQEGDYEFFTEGITGLTATDTVHIAFRNSLYTGGDAWGYFYVLSVHVQKAPNCHRPDSVVVSNVTASGATLTWPNTGATRYELTIDDSTYSVTTNTITLTGLAAGTNYAYSLVGICSDTSIALQGSFATECPAFFTLPYSENFDSYANNSIPNCWTRKNLSPDYYGNQTPYVSTDDYYAHSGVGSLYFYGGANKHPMAITPALGGAAINNLYVSFWIYGSSSIGFVAGIMTDPDVDSTFIPLLNVASTNYGLTHYTFTTDSIVDTSSVYHFAIRFNNNSSYSGNIALDDLLIRAIPDCAEDFDGIHVGNITADSVTVYFTPGLGRNVGADYTVNVMDATGTVVATANTGTSPVALGGLNESTTYTATVSINCGGSVTATSEAVTFTTRCGGSTMIAIEDANSGNNAYLPINNFYRHSASQQIYRASELGNPADITSVAFNYDYSTPLYGFMAKIYMAHTTDTIMGGSWVNHANMQLVYEGYLDCPTSGWNEFLFSTPFSYNGVDNVVLMVIADSTNYTSGYRFKSHFVGTGASVIYYSDDNPYTYGATSYVSSSNYRNDVNFFACGAVVCDQPLFVDTVVNETSVTVSYSGGADSYEVAIVPGTLADFEGAIATTTIGTDADTVHTFSGLTGLTQYTLGVRGVCGVARSPWATMTVNTLRHPCYVPTTVSFSDRTYEGATISWVAGEVETAWEVNVHSNSPYFDQTYTVNDTPTLTVDGLSQGTTYNVTVRALCDSAWYSDWSTVDELTTVACERVTGVTASSVTATTATIAWVSTGVDTYEIEYGIMGFQTGTGTMVTSTTNGITLTGLEDQTTYDVFVRGYCTETVYSGWSEAYRFTANAGGIGIADVENSLVTLFPNPASSVVTVAGLEGESIVTVVDLNGREVFKGHATGSLTLDVTGYAKGAYFVRVTGESTTAIRKLIVR